MMASDTEQHQSECPSCTVPAASSSLDPATGLCNFCADPPPPLDAGDRPACPHSHPLDCDCPCAALDAVVAPALLDEVDEHLEGGRGLGRLPVSDAEIERISRVAYGPPAPSDALLEALTARMAHACSAFPVAGGWSCYVTEVDGNRITISATRRDPETRTCTTREFIAELREVV